MRYAAVIHPQHVARAEVKPDHVLGRT
jgi:hypothetical protein